MGALRREIASRPGRGDHNPLCRRDISLMRLIRKKLAGALSAPSSGV
jgi:hypothetical protein